MIFFHFAYDANDPNNDKSNINTMAWKIFSQASKNLEILDARKNQDIVKSLYNEGYDINNGSIIKYGKIIKFTFPSCSYRPLFWKLCNFIFMSMCFS